MTPTNKLILNAGIYDLCHAGHLRLLQRMRAAAGSAGRLAVVIHDDRSTFLIKGKIPLQTLQHRCQNLHITGLVDTIDITSDTDPAAAFEEIVQEARAQGLEVTYMRGDDLTGDFPGRWKLEELKVPIVLLPYTKGVSSTQIRAELEKTL